jgi:hypothetical protein
MRASKSSRGTPTRPVHNRSRVGQDSDHVSHKLRFQFSTVIMVFSTTKYNIDHCSDPCATSVHHRLDGGGAWYVRTYSVCHVSPPIYLQAASCTNTYTRTDVPCSISAGVAPGKPNRSGSRRDPEVHAPAHAHAHARSCVIS